MKAWLHRWPNGDTSLVWANDRLQASELLDEIGAAPDADPHLDAGAVHSHPSDSGRLKLKRFDDGLDERIAEGPYPVLGEVEDRYADQFEDLDAGPPGNKKAAEERPRRETASLGPDAKTPAGRIVQLQLGMGGTSGGTLCEKPGAE